MSSGRGGRGGRASTAETQTDTHWYLFGRTRVYVSRGGASVSLSPSDPSNKRWKYHRLSSCTSTVLTTPPAPRPSPHANGLFRHPLSAVRPTTENPFPLRRGLLISSLSPEPFSIARTSNLGALR
jgi:hypothetical protein